MSLFTAAFASRHIKLLGLAALTGAALLVSQAFAGRAAHAEEPPQPGIQQIVTPGQASINADRNYYHVGDWAYICYTLPTNGYFYITDHQPGQPVKVLKSQYGYGGLDCFWGQVTPPFGYETLRLYFYFPYGGSAQAQDTFYVSY